MARNEIVAAGTASRRSLQFVSERIRADAAPRAERDPVSPNHGGITIRRCKLEASGEVIVSLDRALCCAADALLLIASYFNVERESGHLGRSRIEKAAAPFKAPLAFVADIMAPVCQNTSKHNPGYEIPSSGPSHAPRCIHRLV